MTRRSQPSVQKKIDIIIKERTIEDYLDKNKKDRELSDIILKEFISKQYNQFISDNVLPANQYASTRKWLISRDVLNCQPSFETPLRDEHHNASII